MVGKTIEELRDMYSLKNIIRYNNLPRIRDESVAEHSFFVAFIVARLHLKYEFDLGKALLTATVHDVFETVIGDLPRNIKNKYPKLDRMMTVIESDVIDEKYPEYKQIIDEMNNDSTVEGLIVKLADAKSVLQYADSEMTLGNTFYMPEVVENCMKTITKLEKKLEPYLRLEQTRMVYS